MKKLAQISSIYQESGLAEMPAAIIQHGSLPNEKKVICTAGPLEQAARDAGLTYPAIIIIGAVVAVGNPLHA